MPPAVFELSETFFECLLIGFFSRLYKKNRPSLLCFVCFLYLCIIIFTHCVI